MKKKLINFENKIANLFNRAKITAPIHLYSNNEDKLIKIFKKIKKKRLGFLLLEISLSVPTKRSSRKIIRKRDIGWKINFIMFPQV